MSSRLRPPAPCSCCCWRTRFGRQWRAFADDPGAAALFGVARERLIASTFVLAGLMTGLAGWIVAVYYGNVSFAMGTTLGLKALVAAVIGGIGSVPGAFLGGILVGLIEAGLWSAYFDIAFRDVVVFSLMIVMFVLRPGGLLGFAGPSREAGERLMNQYSPSPSPTSKPRDAPSPARCCARRCCRRRSSRRSPAPTCS